MPSLGKIRYRRAPTVRCERYSRAPICLLLRPAAPRQLRDLELLRGQRKAGGLGLRSGRPGGGERGRGAIGPGGGALVLNETASAVRR